MPLDLLIEAGTVLPMTPGATVITDGAIGVAGDRIQFVGPRAALPVGLRVRRRVRVEGGIACPGLINLHAHLPHSLLCAVGDGLPVSKWLDDLIFPVERAVVDERFVEVGTELGIAQMLAAGVTTTVDMYYFEAAMARVVDRCGYRAVLGQTVIGHPAPDARAPGEGLGQAERFVGEFAGHPRVQPAVAPHATYTAGPDLLRAAGRLARTSGAPLLIHLSEARSEIAAISERYGKSPIAHLHELGLLDLHVIGAHVIYPQEGDLDLLQRHRVAVAHCPQSNLHMGEAAAPVREYLDRGLPVGLGTDGAGSAPSVDLLQDAALCGRLMKLRSGRADEIRASDLLHLLTAGAAAALRRPDLGTLAAGQRADILVVEPAGPLPDPELADPFAHLVYASQHRRVALTVVDGRILFDRGTYLTLDTVRLRREVRQQRERIAAVLR